MAAPNSKPPECPACHEPLGFARTHRRYCFKCGQELPRPVDPRLRHAAEEGDRRRHHGDRR